MAIADFTAQFRRLDIVLRPRDLGDGTEAVLNPACTRLRDGSLQLYPRIVAPGNVSSIGSFRVMELSDNKIALDRGANVLEPRASYELRHESDGHGCEDPRVTYIAELDRYVMAYVAFGPRGPEVALAISSDGLSWTRLGLVMFKHSGDRFADKDAAFFPEPVISPKGVPALAFYHRPTQWALWRESKKTAVEIVKRSGQRETIAIGYVSLEAVRADITKLCEVIETHELVLPVANWGSIKVGAGTPPVRIREGWLGIIHGVDQLSAGNGSPTLQYSAGIVIHSAERLDHILYRSPMPLFVPELHDEIYGKVGHVVFPSGIDPRPDIGDRVFDIYYGMGDCDTGRGRLTLES